MDAVELTLLLKAAGFRLESFDFKQGFTAGNGDASGGGVRVEITCQKSGIVSRLTDAAVSPSACSCPPASTHNNNSFWEVHGTKPSTSLGGVQVQYIFIFNYTLQNSCLYVVRGEY